MSFPSHHVKDDDDVECKWAFDLFISSFSPVEKLYSAINRYFIFRLVFLLINSPCHVLRLPNLPCIALKPRMRGNKFPGVGSTCVFNASMCLLLLACFLCH